MNRESGTFERLYFDPENSDLLSGPHATPQTPMYEHISFITEDSRGNFWVGTTQSGIILFQADNGRRIHYVLQENTMPSFEDNGAWNAFTSRNGIFWIGGTSGNIYRINPNQKEIPFYEAPEGVNSFYEEPGGALWLATDQKIIKKEGYKTTANQYEIDITPNTEDDDYVQIIKEDRQGNIWIGGNNGLNLWDGQNKPLIPYKHDPGNRKSLSNNRIITIYEDAVENLWIGTIDGLNLMDKNTGTFRKYYLNQVDTGFIGLNIVTSVLQDVNGKLWVGTWNGGGVYILDPTTNTTKSYLKGSNVVCLYEDAEKTLWVGSTNGLFRFNPESNEFVRYVDLSLLNGFIEVSAIVEDDKKFLWVSTSNGLVRINPSRNETNRMGKAYGIGGVNFSWNSSYKGRNGHIYFGTETGYYTFDPETIIEASKPPEIIFSAFRLANQLVSPGAGSPIQKNLNEVEEIRLRANQNVFSFDYAIIDYTNPDENQLIYILENHDNNWLQANSERKAYYFNVLPGKYTFRVKAANSLGLWAEKQIQITILPPWWKTLWAYGIYALVFGLLVFGFDRIQRRRIKMIERQKGYKREREQAKEIEKAYNKLKTTQIQLLHAEKMASLGELTAGIAHEIQNPLNFINNFSEVNTELIVELKEEVKKGDTQEVLSIANNIAGNEEKIIHHGKRADGIVKGMLQHSRTASNEKEPTDINSLADEYLRLSYHGLRAKDKSFNADFDTRFDKKLPKVNAVPQDIGRVILNLITNAFQAVSERSKVVKDDFKPFISVTTKKENDWIVVMVEDNGGGISAEVVDKIFQPFFTTKSAGDGTGLGLSLSYDIITKGHGGRLHVKTKQGEGSIFIVELPIY